MSLHQWEIVVVIAVGVSAVIGAGYSVGRAFRSCKAAMAEGVSRAVDHSDTGKLVKYHLGPNGTTPPIHQRIRRLEEAHNIEQTEVNDEGH